MFGRLGYIVDMNQSPNQNMSQTNKNLPESVSIERMMQAEYFNQIIVAILEAKYSWACVLILRFSGCNPVDYIPSRTYRRLCNEQRSKQLRSKSPIK
jgi:hypothetical protein